MQFELNDALVDDILFYMENQDGVFLLDTRDGIVVSADDFNDDDEQGDFSDSERFISLPDWSANDGFRLMEHFAASLKNPVIREELSAALNRGKGVFRSFKNVLEQYPETEKQWYNYKEREMRREVIDWYNSYREEWGLSLVGNEPEDNTSLVLEDFIIKECGAGKAGGDFSFTAENADGDIAASINAQLTGDVLHIKILEVKPEYRGMGIAKTLLSKMIEKADEHKLNISIDVPAETNFFSRSLLLEEFKPYFQRFIRAKN